MKQGLTEVAGVLERLGTHEWASVENGAVCHLQEATKVQSKACDNAFSMWAATKRDFSMPKSKSVDELQDQTKMLDDTTAQISGAYIKYRKNELGAFINVKAATADEEYTHALGRCLTSRCQNPHLKLMPHAAVPFPTSSRLSHDFHCMIGFSLHDVYDILLFVNHYFHRMIFIASLCTAFHCMMYMIYY